MDDKQIRSEARRLAAALNAQRNAFRGEALAELDAHCETWGRIAAEAIRIDPRIAPLLHPKETGAARIAGYLAGRLAERERQRGIARNG